MKKLFTTAFALLAFSLTYAQTNIPVNNGDIEDTTPMYQNKRNGDKWTIEGMWFNENSKPGKFDAANSGLAPDEGRNGSQAIKSKVINGTGNTAHVTLSFGDNDISSYGPGTYTFTFYAKSLKAPTERPFWIVCNAINGKKKNVTNQTLTVADNGGTVDWKGLENGYLKQSITVKVSDTTKAQNLRLQVQHARNTNTFWFDDFTLTKLD
ncbi:hypothetical protein [Marinilabilia rubra]|nr:hypothetical protein [Marinilabilia rubra]